MGIAFIHITSELIICSSLSLFCHLSNSTKKVLTAILYPKPKYKGPWIEIASEVIMPETSRTRGPCWDRSSEQITLKTKFSPGTFIVQLARSADEVYKRGNDKWNEMSEQVGTTSL